MRLLLCLFALLASPALAQDPLPQGIAFAQAEEGTWLCRGENPEDALACARELCVEQASGQECWPTAWCFPANWSGLMTIWLADFHTTHVLCGAPSEAALTQALAAICAGDTAAMSCDVTLTIDPAGNERAPEGVSFVGPAAPAEPTAGTPDNSAADATTPAGSESGEIAPADIAPEDATPPSAGPAANGGALDAAPSGG